MNAPRGPRSAGPAGGERAPERHPFLTAVGAVTSALGSGPALVGAVLVIVAWAATGPLFGFSDTWQLMINTLTTLVTFVMVFVIQSSQNRDSRAIQVKLDDILESLRGADSSLVGIEDEPERVIKRLQQAVRDAARRELRPPAGDGGTPRQGT